MLRGEVWLYLITGMLLTSLLLREAELFVVGLILLLVAAVAWVWQRHCLTGLGYRRSLGQVRAAFGEEVSLTLEIVNDKPLPLAWLEIEDAVPAGLPLSPAHAGPSHIPGRRLLGMLLSIRWYERVRRHYRVTCQARGFHAFGPATLRTGDVFGLATQEVEIPGEDYLLVYPRIVPLERLGLPASNPESCHSSDWVCPPPIHLATPPCADSGCSRIRCAQSACETIDPATARVA